MAPATCMLCVCTYACAVIDMSFSCCMGFRFSSQYTSQCISAVLDNTIIYIGYMCYIINVCRLAPPEALFCLSCLDGAFAALICEEGEPACQLTSTHLLRDCIPPA